MKVTIIAAVLSMVFGCPRARGHIRLRLQRRGRPDLDVYVATRRFAPIGTAL
jgi:hypothetical protein